MTQEQFEALGIEKSLAKKAAEASKKELEGYVSKDTYDQTEQQRKQLETSANDYKTQLEDLKTAAGDNAELTKKIEDLQAENQEKGRGSSERDPGSEAVQRDPDGCFAASAQDSDLVAGLLDRTKLILGDDGKVTGLDEQVKALKESKPFLFKSEQKPDGKKGFFPSGRQGSWRNWRRRRSYEHERGNRRKTGHGPGRERRIIYGCYIGRSKKECAG